jgi:hypothetical protein
MARRRLSLRSWPPDLSLARVPGRLCNRAATSIVSPRHTPALPYSGPGFFNGGMRGRFEEKKPLNLLVKLLGLPVKPFGKPIWSGCLVRLGPVYRGFF